MYVAHSSQRCNRYVLLFSRYMIYSDYTVFLVECKLSVQTAEKISGGKKKANADFALHSTF